MVKSYSNWEYYPKFEFVSILLENYLAFNLQRHYLCRFWFVDKIGSKKPNALYRTNIETGKRKKNYHILQNYLFCL